MTRALARTTPTTMTIRTTIMIMIVIVIVTAGGLGPAALRAAETLPVGRGERYTTIAAALTAARPGDTIRVGSGVYRERPLIEKRVVLIGVGRPVIDGDGSGTVVTVLAPAEIRGFAIRGSGESLDEEDSGIMARADSCRIIDNVLTDVLFGIYLKEADASRIAGNRIVGKDRPPGVRGDGIRLWYSHDAVIEGNRVSRTRDVVIYFSHGLRFRRNYVEGGRYGLHYMYSDHNAFEENEFVNNDVAAFLMYSSDIELRDNVFARASGSSGFGVGLKDADRIVAVDNLMVQNRVGIYLDNSPRSVDVRNRFQRNVFAFNDIAISPLPSVHSNDFIDNSFRGNVREVAVSGGGTAVANDWSGNYWEDAPLWDENGDGIGDYPYRVDRLSDDLFARHPALRLFELSPAASILDALGRFFPLLEPRPILVDSAPRIEPVATSEPPGFQANTIETGPDTPARRSPGAAALWLGVAGLALWGARRWPL